MTTTQTQNGHRGRPQFTARSRWPITQEDAMQAQRRHGFDPMGYGFDSFRVQTEVIENEQIEYVATWSCSHSCD